MQKLGDVQILGLNESHIVPFVVIIFPRHIELAYSSNALTRSPITVRIDPRVSQLIRWRLRDRVGRTRRGFTSEDKAILCQD